MLSRGLEGIRTIQSVRERTMNANANFSPQSHQGTKKHSKYKCYLGDWKASELFRALRERTMNANANFSPRSRKDTGKHREILF